MKKSKAVSNRVYSWKSIRKGNIPVVVKSKYGTIVAPMRIIADLEEFLSFAQYKYDYDLEWISDGDVATYERNIIRCKNYREAMWDAVENRRCK